MNRGLILAAPSSGSGKTTVTLGLLRARSRRGQPVRGGKSGPDYIDTRFHQAACRQECFNLDAWAMPETRIKALAQGQGHLLIEGAMGLFDGAPPHGTGATADLARMLQLPVVLVVDASHMAQSVAPLVAGFAHHDDRVDIAGIILNKVGSPRHEVMLRGALASQNAPILGAIHRRTGLAHPSRHLGLVPAGETTDLEIYLDRVADVIDASVDVEALFELAEPVPFASDSHPKLSPPAQRIAIASDAAFQFAYPHILTDWREAGANISFFSPLLDEGPGDVDMVFLPGGYPELHAARLADARNFRSGMVKASQRSTIYGECGGYMVMGDALIDANGIAHKMLSLLRLEASFSERKLHLGYRKLTSLGGPFSGAFNGHEFHYTTTKSAKGEPLFNARDSTGSALGDMGLRNGNCSGSFAHIIDRAI